MNDFKTLLLLSLTAALVGCGVLPLQSDIKENHFRLENFKRDISSQKEYVNLMCFHKKPTSWAQPKQYPAGKHDLWVQANITNSKITNKEAFAQFKVQLNAGKSYMINRDINEEKISLWIQDANTGERVSEIITKDLERPLLKDDIRKKDRCKLGSI